jgi:hypothetical protein
MNKLSAATILAPLKSIKTIFMGLVLIRILMKIADYHSQCTYSYDLAMGCLLEILPLPL